MTKERETHLNLVSDDRTHWLVFTDDPIMIRLFDTKKYEKIRSVGLGFEYKIPFDKIEFVSIKPQKQIKLIETIEKPKTKRNISSEERYRRSERMRQYQANKRKEVLSE